MRWLCILFISGVLGIKANAQTVAIAAVGIQPDSSAMLDVNSSSKGLLLPRLTSLQRNAIKKPATALVIFNTDLRQFQVNTGNAVSPVWQSIVSLADSSNSNGVWLTNGNQLETDTAFIGSTNAQPFSIRTNNTVRLYFDSTSNRVGLGTTAPKTSLHINATDAIIVPVGNTAQRPPQPVIGMIRFNSTTSKLEGYTSNGWVPLH